MLFAKKPVISDASVTSDATVTNKADEYFSFQFAPAREYQCLFSGNIDYPIDHSMPQGDKDALLITVSLFPLLESSSVMPVAGSTP